MASTIKPSSTPTPAVQSKRLKLRGLREAMAARKGSQEPSSLVSDEAAANAAGCCGSTKTEGGALIQGGVSQGGDNSSQENTAQGLDRENCCRADVPLLPRVETDRKEPRNDAKSDETVSGIVVASKGSTSLTDFEKKQQRAERFGVDLQVSEEEKRKLRAARFGTEGIKKVAGNKSESQKRQERAARFGIVNDEIKKKARLERFGLNSKQGTSPESEKRKLRSARFQTNTTKNPIGDTK